MKIDVVTLDNEKAGSIELADPVFAAPVRGDILARMVNWQRAKRRAGTHNTKGISEVRGTTAKPYKQKGTGRARHGSRRSPQWRGGSVTFGPRPRSHAHKLPKKVRRMALRAALSSKREEGRLIVLDAATAEDHRTAALAARIEALGWRSALIIGGAELDPNFARAAANLPDIDVLPQQGANVYDILRRETLVLTREAVSHLEERLS